MSMYPSDPIPEDFVHLLQDRDFLRGAFMGERREVVGVDGALGARLQFGPLCVEYYTCDQEPTMLPFRGLRFVLWCPIIRLTPPKGWSRSPLASGRMVFAYFDIRDKETYRKNLNRTLRTYFNHWAKQTEYRIKEVTHDNFSELYEKYAQPVRLTPILKKSMANHYIVSKDNFTFYVLESLRSGEVVAGVSGVDYPAIKQSYYMAAFTRKDIAPPEAGFWLLNHWIDKSRDKGISFTNLGVVWEKGRPKSWKGYSDFKMKFNPKYIVLPREFMKFTFSLKKQEDAN